MTFKLTAEQQAIVNGANRLSASASEAGRAPSKYFLDKCDSEAGAQYSPVAFVKVEQASDLSNDLVLMNYRPPYRRARVRNKKHVGFGEFASALKTLLLHR